MSTEVLKSIRGFNIKEKEIDDALVEKLRKSGESEIISQLLAIRNIKPEEKKNFFEPKLENFLSANILFKDLEKAVARLLQAIKNNEKICIFGDYDVDGTTSTAMLVLFFQELGIDASYYIPDRINEGYGPNINAMEKIAKNRISLLICVDCGVNAIEPLETAKNLGMDVIIFDHHKSGENLPQCVACVDPNRIDETEQNDNTKCLCACGVSFIVLTELNQQLKKQKMVADIWQFIPLVAFATICDVMNLTPLNRAFIRTGISLLKNKGRDFNLNELLGVVEDIRNRNSMSKNSKKYDVNVQTFGFLLGPMINAGGRIGRSSLGVELMIEKNIDNAIAIAERLYYLNEERKDVEDEALKEIFIKKEQEIQEQIANQGVIVLYSKDWHEGVIGLIASRIKEKYHYPVFAGTELSDGTIKFSARSVEGVDIGVVVLQALEEGILIAGGGHKAAAGLTCSVEKIEKFINFLKDKIKNSTNNSFNNRTLEYDVSLSLGGLSVDVVEKISKFEPFGVGNQKPIFLIQDVIVNWTKVVNEKHVVISLEDASRNISAICFNCINTDLGNFLLSSKNQVISILATADVSEFKGQKKVNIKIEDVIA